jgi:hypothetical protein
MTPTFAHTVLNRDRNKKWSRFNLVLRVRAARTATSLIASVLVWATAMSVWTPATLAAENYQSPVYNPTTRSYFQLVQYPITKIMEWWDAKQEAETRIFKGVRGRLAVVANKEVHDFLRDRLEAIGETWIGLRYWCEYHKLQWVTGQLLSRQDFSNWHPQWFRDPNVRCNNGLADGDYMPIYYTSSQDGGFLWQAVGPAKAFHAYYVEYPTNGE